MDWTTLGSVLGSNFFIALVSLATARWQINNAKAQLDKQLRNEKERERRERRREIRSEGLIKLGEELASLGAKMSSLVVLKSLPACSEVYKETLIEVMKYMFGGELKKASYLVGEPEFMVLIVDLIAVWSAEPLPTEESEVKALIYKAEQKIVQIESLINKRLEEM